MLLELQGANTGAAGYNIELIGINRPTSAAYNFLAVSGRTLPWLQDGTADSVWTDWNVVYRDVRILDPSGRPAGVYNLTQNDLSLAGNRETLKNMLLAAAQPVDSDSDQLPDAWEIRWFGDLSQTGAGDPDLDGRDNRSEFALGTHPARFDAASAVRGQLDAGTGSRKLFLIWRKPAGRFFDYAVEGSTDLASWIGGTAGPRLSGAPRNLFDGSGAEEVIYDFTPPSETATAAFMRLRMTPRAP